MDINKAIPYLASKFTQDNFKKMQVNLLLVEKYMTSIEIGDQNLD